MVVGSTCSLVWERRTTCWVTMRVPDLNIPIVRRPLPVREERDLDHHVTACSEGAGVRGHAGGGGLCWACFRPHFCWGGGGAAKGLLPCFLVPKGDQPTACTLALWWLKFGPTRLPGGRVLLVMLWAAGGGWWWWLWLDCLVVVVSAGGSVCGGGWACLVVVMVCPCGWCWVWYHWACGLR